MTAIVMRLMEIISMNTKADNAGHESGRDRRGEPVAGSPAGLDSRSRAGDTKTGAASDQTGRPEPKLTKQRQLILDHLDRVDEFLTAQQLHVTLRNEGETIGLATVYRGLQWLEEAGIVDAIRTEDGEVAYRQCSVAHHHHLICRRCGKAIEVSGEALEEWSRAVATQYGYTEPEHFVEVYGLCPECSGKPATS